MRGNWLLCDFHIHTKLSDGRVPLKEVIDLYGENGFDAISITDHVYDKHTIKLWQDNNETPPTVWKEDFREYLNLVKKESKRAWDKYRMLVIPGIELSNNHGLYHILAIDVKEYIDPNKDVKSIIADIHAQGAIAIACHPHKKDSEPEMPFMHLWDNVDDYATLFDAWEVANRDDLFNVVSLKKLNYIAGSDFHDPWHLYSWKSLIKSPKNKDAIKEEIHRNKDVAIYLFRKMRAKERRRKRP